MPKQKTAAIKKVKKTRKVVTKAVKAEEIGALKSSRYLETVGRRKTSIARLRLFTEGEKSILVNGKAYEKYFPTQDLQQILISPLEKMSSQGKFGLLIKVRGGGIHSQAEAVRHALSRALVLFNPDFKKRLKNAGFLSRDSRMRERKKFGLKRARRAPQWQKR